MSDNVIEFKKKEEEELALDDLLAKHTQTLLRNFIDRGYGTPVGENCFYVTSKQALKYLIVFIFGHSTNEAEFEATLSNIDGDVELPEEINAFPGFVSYNNKELGYNYVPLTEFNSKLEPQHRLHTK